MANKLFGNKNSKNPSKVYCLGCGRLIEPFYSYCIYCGRSTEDNPKCHATEKETKQIIKNAVDNLNTIKKYQKKIENDTIARSMEELVEKAESIIKLSADDESSRLSSSVRSLFDIHLPRLCETIGKYVELQEGRDDDERLLALNDQLSDGLDNYCKVFDSVADQAYEDDLADVSVDLTVLRNLSQKYL